MPTTSNFGWTTPADTDLVKDGALAIRTLGNGIDTSFLDLKGGTTGQVLSKASNTDLDYTWVTTNDADAIQNSIVDAKGDLIAASAADTPARLAVGSDGTVLTAASGETTGLKWATPTAPANFTLLNTGGTALTAATTVTVSGISGADKILIVVVSASSANASAEFYVRLNTDTGTNYLYGGGAVVGYSTYSASVVDRDAATTATKIPMANMSTNAGSTVSGYLLLSGCNTAGVKVFNGAGGANASTGNTNANYSVGGVYTGTSTISSISMFSSSGNFDAGTVYVYTSA